MNNTGVPVLMYHGVLSIESDIGNPIHISINDFEEQMSWLYKNGYQIITISQMLEFFQHKVLPPKCVVLTFDDGYQSLLTNVTPILEKFGFSATLFLLTGAVGKPTYADFNAELPLFPDNDCPLNWDQLKIMETSCWDVQSHSRNHYTYEIRDEVLENEMRSSREEIEYHLQKKVDFYSYPYGSYDTRSLELVKTTGYKAAFSVHPGMAKWNSDIRRLPRIDIDRFTNLDSFKRKIKTGYSGGLNRLTSSIRYAFYKNTRFKDVLKNIYDRTR